MAGLATADLGKREAAYAEAQKVIWGDAPVVFLDTPDNPVYKAKNLSGV